MCFKPIVGFFRRSYRKSCFGHDVEEDVERRVELQPLRPEEVLVKDLLTSLQGQEVLECEVFRVRDDIREGPSLHLVTKISDQMKRKIEEMKMQSRISEEDMESLTTPITSTSTTPEEPPMRCFLVIFPLGRNNNLPLTVDGKPEAIEWFENHKIDPTQSDGKIGDLFQNVEVEKVLAGTEDTDTVWDLWHGPMQICLRWHKHHVVIGRDLNPPFLPDRSPGWDLGMVHVGGRRPATQFNLIHNPTSQSHRAVLGVAV